MKYKKDVETVAYHSYAIYEKSPSLYIKGEFSRHHVGTRCPRCRLANAPLTHGGCLKCECGLEMELHGNALEIWEDG